MKNLSGRVVIVTGGASGLGEAMVARFADEGARVVVADLNMTDANSIATRTGCKSVRLDATDPDSMAAAIGFTVEAFGRLDVLINNAGVESARAITHESTLENWRKVIDVNLTGVFHGLKYGLAQLMKQGGGGNIVNITSTAGIVGVPGFPPYSAAKSGVCSLTRAAAVEYGEHNIRVNAVAPAGIVTPLYQRMSGGSNDTAALKERTRTMSPLRRVPTASDVAAAVAFLASDDALFISGVTLPVDGGFTAQ